MACNIDIEHILARTHSQAAYLLACRYTAPGIYMVALVDYAGGIGQDKLYMPIISKRVRNCHIASPTAYRHLIINR